ncbi:MAG: hypothetical protein INF12_14670 [Methylobacterium sp.]|nr:hypothetical protein [Methylobacterium sp.]
MQQQSAGSVETASDLGTDAGAIARRWITEIDLFEREAKDWHTRAKKVMKRYKDERSLEQSDVRKFALLWANVETLKPACYAKTPKAAVQRRFKDSDAIARIAAEVAERTLDYFMDCTGHFDKVQRDCVEDFLLPGIGVAWERYVPHTRIIEGADTDDGAQVSETATDDENEDDAKPEEIEYEEAVTDYIYWQDFGWNAGARTWSDVYAVWRVAYMTRDELTARFGDDIGKKVPLDYEPKGLDKDHPNAEMFKKARVFEIWCKTEEKVYWISKSYGDQPLDVRDDPLGLEGFFPCAMPLFATQTNDTLIPVPDYLLYQDQAEEIDGLTARIASLQKALKVRGLYAGDLDEIKRLLQDGNDQDMIPVQNWAMFAEKGGIANAVSYFPVMDVANVLKELIFQRQQLIQDVYQITGISDIVRGETNANETATAQQLKSQWGSLRIRDRQSEVQRFVRDQLRIKFEIIFNHFSPETIKKIANVSSLKDALQPVPGPDGQPMMGADGQPVLMIDAALALLKDKALRKFRVDIETDSTIQADEQAEKQARNEFLQAVGGFFQSALPVLQAAPTLAPMFGEMLMFGVRGYKAGAQLEQTIESTMGQLTQMMNPQAAAEGEQQAQAQAAARETEVKAQIEQAKIQSDQATEAARLQLEREKLQADMAKHQDDVALKSRELDQRDRDMALREQEIGVRSQLEAAKLQDGIAARQEQAQREQSAIQPEIDAKQATADLAGIVRDALAQHTEATRGMMATLSKPKRVRKNPDGSYVAEAVE